ncbi:BREX system ATP-binding domain-containing protein [Peptostreptococcaceae bacterium AGR-M142]
MNKFSDIEQSDCAKIAESFRHGSMPISFYKKLCIGRTSEIAYFNKILNKINDKSYSYVKFLKGEYGSGKTFLLNIVKELGLEKNFVVAKIDLNGNEIFSKIEDVYYLVVNNLESIYGKGLYSILENKLNNDNIDIVTDNLLKINPLFSMILNKYYQNKDNMDIKTTAISYLTGNHENMYIDYLHNTLGLKSKIKNQNALLYLNSLSELFKTLGFSGFIILVDEIEAIKSAHNRNLRDKALFNIRTLFDKANEKSINSTLWIFSGTNDFFVDSKKGIKSYNALSDRLYLEEYKSMDNPIINLDKLSLEDITSLSFNIYDIYRNAYRWPLNNHYDEGQKLIPNYIQFKYDTNKTFNHRMRTRDILKDFIKDLDKCKENSTMEYLNSISNKNAESIKRALNDFIF